MVDRNLALAVLTLCSVVAAGLAIETVNVGDERVRLVDNGYEGIVVAIAEGIPQSSDLITNIKGFIEQGSERLFHATKKRAYFKTVSILIPAHWKRTLFPNLKQATKEKFSTANIIVADANDAYGDQPYVKLDGECGKPGGYIHLTEGFFHSIRQDYGDPGKVMVHEWGHLRWGLYDEYWHKNQNPRYQPFFLDTETLKATSCGLNIAGQFEGDCSQHPLPSPEKCSFKPYIFGDTTASMMYYQFLPNVIDFCDNNISNPDTLHNKYANNPHNFICNGKSAWEIMRKHIDFANGANRPMNREKVPSTTFEIIQAKPFRIVLVLDVSGSMSSIVSTLSSFSRIQRLRQQSMVFFDNVAQDGTYIGIVTFSKSATVVKELTILNWNTKGDLKKKLPQTTYYDTCIGCGLKLGMKVLEEFDTSGKADGGHILLITDGMESTAISPLIADVKEELKTKGVAVHSILYGDEAEPKVVNLSKITGGIDLFDKGTGRSIDLLESLKAIADQQMQLHGNSTAFSPQVQLFLQGYTLAAQSVKHITFMLDDTVGQGTTFSFTYQATNPSFTVKIYSPSGVLFSSADSLITTVDTVARIMKMDIPGRAEVGEWSVMIASSGTRDNVQLLVSSRGRGKQILLSSSLGISEVDFKDNQTLVQIIKADLSLGLAPIVNANVKAIIETSDDIFEVLLKDNGMGADTIENDGIYASYFMQYRGNGKYRVRIKVSSDSNETKVITGGLTGVIDQKYVIGNETQPDMQYQALKNVNRFGSAGFFTVANQLSNSSGDYVVPDVFPPSRITDLRVKDIDSDIGILTLEWTAPGDDYDFGKAERYELRYCKTIEEARESFMGCTLIEHNVNTNSSLISPKAAYSTETMAWQVPPEIPRTTTLVIAIKTIDDENLESEVSNIISTTLNTMPTNGNFRVWIYVTVVAVVLGVVGLLAMPLCFHYRRLKRGPPRARRVII